MKNLSLLKGAFAAFALVLGTLSSATIASADDNFGTIRGRVTLPDRTPVCGLRVTAQSAHNMPLWALTRADGSYVFLGALPGDYTVDFGTYEHLERRAHVSPMLTTTVDSPVPPTRYPKRLDATLKAAVLHQCPPPSYPVYGYYTLNS